ncbi:PepSY domain-containing protein [Lederbergia panacisoli]|uniref:PepSY domain-containing protein n=1 Tax=Lederbergia panacisoli TaxID=1255251 RepID=UPI00214C77C0|nr:PepSY domain-containing protein [Lederbergia panacisoli]MCR2821661.1 PepSY domain-containing protein [Lederbergia panacisoli]
MEKLNMKRFGMGAALFILVVIIAWQFLVVTSSGEAISEAEAKKIATDRFNGKIVHFELKDDIYDMTIQLTMGKYYIKIDRFSGDVLDISRGEEEKVQRLSTDEIKRIIQKEQDGKIEDLKMRIKNQVAYYDAVVENSENKVFITLNAASGEIVNKKEEKKTPVKEETTKNLTKEEAVKIALKTVQGKVDDVDLEELNGQLYYFVEIETDDKEADIQINAITGEVKSIEWDD